jgi:hypothetical protein
MKRQWVEGVIDQFGEEQKCWSAEDGWLVILECSGRFMVYVMGSVEEPDDGSDITSLEAAKKFAAYAFRTR